MSRGRLKSEGLTIHFLISPKRRQIHAFLHKTVLFTCRKRRQEALDIYSSHEFWKLLERERARSDRTGHGFSVLVFVLKAIEELSVSPAIIVEKIQRRIRETDLVGWLDDSNIGAFLFDAPAQAAWTVAKDVCEGTPLKAEAPFCRVYTYPYLYAPQESGNVCSVSLPDIQPPFYLKVEKNTETSANIEGKPNAQSTKPIYGLEPVWGKPLPLWKRSMDIIGSLIGLILLTPLFLLVALFIKTVSRGPVFFKQKRIGYMGRCFDFWKFRTMKTNAETSSHENHMQQLISSDTPMKKLDDNNPNIIPFGKLLRKSSIDELPQLINVLWGEMSLVGPRPCLPYEYENYLLWQKSRFDTVPGMTGLWQVSGKNELSFKEMIRLDITYEKQRSFWMDIKILLKTIPAIIGEIMNKHGKKTEAQE